MPAPEYYIGLMSGTSLDGIDAVIVDLSENPVRMIASQSTAFPKALRKDLLSLCTPDGNEIHRTMQADRQLGKLYALCVKKLLGKVELSSSVHFFRTIVVRPTNMVFFPELFSEFIDRLLPVLVLFSIFFDFFLKISGFHALTLFLIHST